MAGVRTVTRSPISPTLATSDMEANSPDDSSNPYKPSDEPLSPVGADLAEPSGPLVGQPPAAPSLKSRAAVFACLAIFGGTIDLWTKQVIFAWRGLPGQKDIWWVIEGYFGIETAVNIGAVFGVGAGQGHLFAVLSIGAAIGILVWLFWFRAAESWWLTTALGLITGGIIGNLYDRLGMWWQVGYPDEWKSGVRDWILWQASDQWKWPNFNIADSLLVVGACMLLYQSFFMVPDEDESV